MNQNVNPFKAAAQYLWDGTVTGESRECWTSICDSIKAAIRAGDCDFVKGKLALQKVRKLFDGKPATAWLMASSPEFNETRKALYANQCEEARSKWDENVQEWRRRFMVEMATQWDQETKNAVR